MKEKVAFLTQRKTFYWGDERRNQLFERVLYSTRNNSFGGIPHAGATIIGSELRQRGYDMEILDLFDPNIHEKLDTNSYELLLISTKDMGRDQGLEIIKKHPEYHGKTAVGGQGVVEKDPSFNDGDVAVVVGRAEGVVSKLLDIHESGGEFKGTHKREKPFTLADAGGEPYLSQEYSTMNELFGRTRLKTIELSTGCTQSCEMCPIANERVTRKPLDVAIRQLEMTKLKPTDILVVLDHNLFNLPRDYLVEFFNYINKNNINWAGEGTIYQVHDDEELMHLMQKKCYSFLAGLETTEPNLVGSRVKQKMVENFDEVNGNVKKCGLPVTWSMVLPLDTHTPESYLKAADFVFTHDINVNSHILQPRVGSAFHRQVTEESRWIHEDSRMRDGGHLVFDPKQMSAEEALAGFIWFRGTIDSLNVVASRYVGNIGNMSPKQALNLAGIDLFSGYFSSIKMRRDHPELKGEIGRYEKQWKKFKAS